MSQLKFSAACLLALLTMPTFPVLAEDEKPAHPEKPLLWKIERENVPPSYLFGTIHVSDPGVTNLHPAAQKAFEASNAVHTEVSMDMSVQLVATMAMLRKDGKTLKQSIGPELSARLDEEIGKIMPGFNSAPFQPMRTWVLPILLPTMKEQLSGAQPLDLVLWERAKKAGKKTRGIQTTADQTKSLDELKEEEQITFLDLSLQALAKAREDGEDPITSMIQLYRKGDPEALSKWFLEDKQRSLDLVKGKPEEALFEKILKGILNDRDVVMADYVKKTLEKEPDSTHFFAVGAAHLALKGGVPDTLREAGVKVTLVVE
ncbi:MAG: TraB/GumN family protein [Verrucomicrobiales bacterium]